MREHYSTQAIRAYILLLITYVGMVAILWFLQWMKVITWSTPLGSDVLPLIASLPFVALYLVVFLAATAGYAHGAMMVKTLPIGQLLKNELQKRKMDRATIQTKIRSGGQVTLDTPYLRALTNLIASRVPILAVVDNDNKVSGVITTDDIVRRLREEIDKPDGASLQDRLKSLKVEQLEPRKPVVSTGDESLEAVLRSMIQHRFTKLIVVDTKQNNNFTGTVDVLDLVGEIFDDSSKE